jgi:voltage-gated potassium channel
LGKIVSTATIFSGLIIVALPVGIIASAFANEMHRRDFVVTWSMVSRVPLFAGLSAAEIADIMKLLRSRQYAAGDVIAHRGEPAHSMYFVAAGEVEIELKDRSVRLGSGHFFGEIAALRRGRRSATIVAKGRTSLLELDAGDLRSLMHRNSNISHRIHEVARGRSGDDFTSEELKLQNTD